MAYTPKKVIFDLLSTVTPRLNKSPRFAEYKLKPHAQPDQRPMKVKV